MLCLLFVMFIFNFAIVLTNVCAVLLKVDIIWTLLLICNIQHQEFSLKCVCLGNVYILIEFKGHAV